MKSKAGSKKRASKRRELSKRRDRRRSCWQQNLNYSRQVADDSLQDCDALMAKKTKKAKTDSRKTTSQTIERRRPYQKPAIRSQAFARAVLNAASYSLDPVSLRTLFEEAA